MTTGIPEEYLDLLEKKSFAYVATVMDDGTPQVTPVWIDTDGTHVIFNTAKGRVKPRNIERDPHVAIAIADPENPYRYIQIRGTATMTEDGAEAHIDALAKKYMGVDEYPFRQEGEERLKVLVTPDNVQAMG